MFLTERKLFLGGSRPCSKVLRSDQLPTGVSPGQGSTDLHYEETTPVWTDRTCGSSGVRPRLRWYLVVHLFGCKESSPGQ